MIKFKDFNKRNYERLLEMMLDFYASDALDTPLSKDIIEKLLNDILSKEYAIKGVEVYFGNELAGFGVFTTYYATEVAGLTIQLEDLYILPEHRSRGIARTYFKWIRSKFPEAARFRLEVEPNNTRAIQLYDKVGFKGIAYNQMAYDVDPKEIEGFYR